MLKIVRQWIIDTLGFSKSEANGTLTLIFLVLIIAILPKIYMHNTFSTTNGFLDEQGNLERWAEELDKSLTKKGEKKAAAVIEQKEIVKSFPFNPNAVTIDQLVELGFSEKTAGTLINYRENGGSFQVKSDLKKIYGISEKRVNQLWEFIQLPEAYPEKEKKLSTSGPEPVKKTEPLKELVKLEINSAREEDLQKIHGIGRTLSARIIKFRNSLGGFHSLSQLEEVYGLSAEVVKSLKAASVLSGEVNRLNINTDSASHLYQHPYIDYNIAYAIVNYRSQHGDFDSISQINRIKIVSDSLYQKIYPYLSLNQ